MIDFNLADLNLKTIRQDSKLYSLQTKNSYRIYGLRQEGNPLIHLSYNYDTVNDDFDQKTETLMKFFQNNNVEFVVESGGGEDRVCLGLRRDLRKKVILTSCILQTIIYYLEDKLDLATTHKIHGVPNFARY